MKWIGCRNYLAWPYGWQRPNKTEEWAYENNVLETIKNEFTEVVYFPWATLIDLLRGNNKKAQIYLDALFWMPPKKTIKRATVLQHIWLSDVMPYLEKIGITDLYWSHARKNEICLNAIKINPFPLYPVCCGVDYDTEMSVDLLKRKYLYSFVGAYDKNLYISNARDHIFSIKHKYNCKIIKRSEWHYNSQVYGVQVNEKIESVEDISNRLNNENEYYNILSESIFSLCPSGAGPNSIRLWESIGMGCIPVIISDDLKLIGDYELWEDASVICGENFDEINELPELLNSMLKNSNKLYEKQKHIKYIWDKYIRMKCNDLRK